MNNKKTIVSITPHRVEADSRTYKIAASFSRFGYISFVVEGQRSNLERKNLPFFLLCIGTIPLDRIFKSLGCEAKNYILGREHGQGFFKKIVRWSVKMGVDFLNNFLSPLLFTPKASLYYLHSPAQFLAIYLLSRLYNVPYIYDAHDFYSAQYSEREASYFKKLFSVLLPNFIELLCIRQAIAIVTVGENIAELYRNSFNRQITVIRNCHDERLDRSIDKNLRKELYLSGEDFLIIAMGKPKPGLATREAIEAMFLLPPVVHLAFLGYGYEGYIDYVRNKGLQNRIHFFPLVKSYEVVSFISSCDASLILYFPKDLDYKNTLPNKFFQSISAELPLLYPELPEIKKIVERYKIGIPIDPQKPESIANAVTELMSDKEKFLTIKQNIRIAASELSWKHEENILCDLVNRLLDKR
jgi:glycosyltransferase involved in cell wall biosynthesis